MARRGRRDVWLLFSWVRKWQRRRGTSTCSQRITTLSCLCMQLDTHWQFCICRAHAGRGCGLSSAHAFCPSWWQFAGDAALLQMSQWNIINCLSSSQNIFWSCRMPVRGMLKMAKNHDNYFGAPVVTKSSFKKPSHVSSFAVETGWMGNITNCQQERGLCSIFSKRSDNCLSTIRLNLQLQNLTVMLLICRGDE